MPTFSMQDLVNAELSFTQKDSSTPRDATLLKSWLEVNKDYLKEWIEEQKAPEGSADSDEGSVSTVRGESEGGRFNGTFDLTVKWSNGQSVPYKIAISADVEDTPND